MRRHVIVNCVVESDADLSAISHRFIRFIDTGLKFRGNALYRVESPLRFYRSEIHGVIGRRIERRLPIRRISGNCSSPSGYFVGADG